MYNYSRPSGETSLGIDERWERVLAYALLWVSGLILLIVEQRNQTVRRHAKQSVIIFGVLCGLALLTTIFSGALGWIPVPRLLYHSGLRPAALRLDSGHRRPLGSADGARLLQRQDALCRPAPGSHAVRPNADRRMRSNNLRA